jgi:putative polyhydroxyalkanoate system protein
MATVDLSQSHSLPPDEAAARVRKLVDEFEQSSDLVKSVAWEADGKVATAKGQGFSARFDVREDEVRVSVDLSMMLRPFKGKVEKQLSRKLDQVLG